MLPPVLMKRLRFVRILSFGNRCPDIIRVAHGLRRVITADITHASREDHEVHKRIWLEPVPASGRGGRRALVELQVRIAA